MSGRTQYPAPVQSDNAADQRFAKRKTSRMPGLIHHATFQQPLQCMVRDSSSTGALIEIAPIKGSAASALSRFPKQFTLTIPLERVAFECDLAWQNDRTLGVRYAAPARILAKPVRHRPKEEAPKGLIASVLKKAGIKAI